MKYIALICARGGSKGIPGKNIKNISGIPMIGWSIRIAKNINRISRVIVSTDSEEIAEIARDFGAEVPFIRPEKLSKDDSPEWLVWRHTIDYLDSIGYKIDGLVSIPVTAPLREIQDVDNCIDDFEKGEVDIVFTVSDASRSPYFNMVTIDKNGYSSLVIPQKNKIFRRQDAPKVFDMTTVAYVVRPDFVQNSDSMYSGRARSVYVPPERAIDIDTPLDFEIAEFLFQKRESVEMF